MGNKKTSRYAYEPLNYSKNEIRTLQFSQPSTSGESIIQCTLRHVSLDAVSPAYRQYVEDNKPATSVSAVRGWIKTHHDTKSWRDIGVKPIKIDAWRHAAEYEKLDSVGNCDIQANVTDHVFIPSRFEWGDFEAISYRWGSNVRDKVIQVNGKVIQITSNLEALLQELQHLPETPSGMNYWVDGLCINQEDILEKNHQVGLMSRIYSQAMSTVVWLGLPTSNSNVAIDRMIEYFGDCRYAYDENVRPGVNKWRFRPSSRTLIWPDHWPFTLDICARQYFRRMWIIQELALSQNMTLFLCGNRRFSRVHLQAACRSVRVSVAESSRAHNHPGPQAGQMDDDSVWVTVNDIYSLIKLRSPVRDLDPLLNMIRKAEVTDPRDKVYGILGLLPRDIADQIEPDYTKSLDEVTMQFARAILSRGQRLNDLLSWCTFEASKSSPSWMPDFTTTRERKYLRGVLDWQAGGEGPAQWSLCRSDLGLSIRAIRMGQVNYASVPARALLPYKAIAKSSVSRAPSGPLYGRYRDKEKLSMALERTLMRGHPKRHESGNLTDVPWIDWALESRHVLEDIAGMSTPWVYFDLFRQSNASFSLFGVPLREFFANDEAFDWNMILTDNNLYLQSDYDSYTYANAHASNLRRTAVALQHRRLCTTETGYLCLVPDEVDIDDTLAVILGCNYPVLLRPFKGGFKYVGECFVDGMMDGEAIDAAARGEYDFEDILLL